MAGAIDGFAQVQRGQLVRAAEDLQLLVAVCQDKSLHLESVTYLLLMAQVPTQPRLAAAASLLLLRTTARDRYAP